MSIRTEKVGSVIKKALAAPLSAIASELNAGFITVTQVRMSQDLRYAKIYLSVFGGKQRPAEALIKIDERSKRLRRELGASVHLRYVPELRFYLDDTLDAIEHIQELIDSVRSADDDNDDTDTPPLETGSPSHD